MSHKKSAVIGLGVFVILVVAVSVTYYLINRPDPDAESYQPIEDQIMQREVSPNLPAADGYGDETPIISSVVDLTSRGLSTQQATYFTHNFIEFISDSDIKHDTMMRIEKSSVERENDRDNNRVITRFNLYITDDTHYKVSLTNPYGERNVVDILVKSSDNGETIYRHSSSQD